MSGASTELLRAIFDAYPAPTFLVDDDVRVVLHNRAAGALTGGEVPSLLRGGEALHCLEAVGRACGTGPRCGECVVRRAVRAALSSGAVHRERAFMQRRLGAEVAEAFFLVSAAPLAHEGRPLVVLTLEDVTLVARLKSLLPMCAGCRKIRNDQDYWQTVETYLKEQLDVDFSHGLCDACADALYPEVAAARRRRP